MEAEDYWGYGSTPKCDVVEEVVWHSQEVRTAVSSDEWIDSTMGRFLVCILSKREFSFQIKIRIIIPHRVIVPFICISLYEIDIYNEHK